MTGAGDEIIEGLFRAGQFVTLTGGFGHGKTPLLMDWAFCVATGKPWCGRAVSQRPVILLNSEWPDWRFRPSWERLAARHGTPPPLEPDCMEVYLEHGSETSPATQALLAVLKRHDYRHSVGWLGERLAAKPNALIVLDPFSRFFMLDRNKGHHIEVVYQACRELRVPYPAHSIIGTFNKRKRQHGHSYTPPSLLENPYEWLEEASGSLDIQNRSNVRVGIEIEGDVMGNGPRVVNGVIQGEGPLDPMFIEPVLLDGPHTEAGWQEVPQARLDLPKVLTPKMKAAWDQLGETFTFGEMCDLLSPTTAYRMKERMLKHGLAVFDGERFRKVVTL